jgi:hypothetical protein
VRAAELLVQVGRLGWPGQARPLPRPLLILTGQSGPSRRFLRAVERYSPQPARHFVVATGDGLSFNTVYRDRQIAWPIQDLPYSLVFFCHRNPVDRDAGFRPVGEAAPHSGAGPAATTGTEDLLLYQDIIEALAYAHATAPADADELRDRLVRTHLTPSGYVCGGRPGALLFDSAGERRGGTGEHVVWLRPQVERFFDDENNAVMRVQPRATLEVWAWRPDPTDGPCWQQAGDTLSVNYVNSLLTEGGAP